MKIVSFAMYIVHIVRMNFCMELGQKLIYNGHTVVGFLPVEYEHLDPGVKEFEKEESSGLRCMDGFKIFRARHCRKVQRYRQVGKVVMKR